MASHATEYVDDEDGPVVGLLKVLRAYGADTSEARLRNDSSETCGTVPLPGRGGRLPVKLQRLAMELGWAVERQDDHLLVAHGEDVDPARDSLLPLTRRTSTDMQKRTFGVDGWTQPGARTLVTVGHGLDREKREGEMARCEDLEAGDDVYVEYRETRRGGGYSFSNTAQEFTATVLHTDDEQVVLEGAGRFDLTQQYEGEATWETPDGETRAVKHLVRFA